MATHSSSREARLERYLRKQRELDAFNRNKKAAFGGRRQREDPKRKPGTVTFAEVEARIKLYRLQLESFGRIQYIHCSVRIARSAVADTAE
jgi:hypothetical protein